MGLLSNIFGTGDVVSKGIDLIDSFHTSDTEMIEAKTKAKTKLMESFSAFKIAQRYLALLFSVTYIFSYILIIIMTLIGNDTTKVNDVLEQFQMDLIMIAIVSFYFGGGLIDSARRKNN